MLIPGLLVLNFIRYGHIRKRLGSPYSHYQWAIFYVKDVVLGNNQIRYQSNVSNKLIYK